ncbi:MAG: hypothetical protein KAQ62_28470, partial [Cyclobacteriaceae bacterium]|nr:hypothetical protein [Cyclobacteriaceae bacterium]
PGLDSGTGPAMVRYVVLAMGDNRSLPPQDQDIWRMDFSRFNQYKEAQPANDSGDWVWSPLGVWDSHVPECFTYIHFSTEDVSNIKRKKTIQKK